jgi:hypothetical protein
MRLKFAVSVLGAAFFAGYVQVAIADAADPEYASNQCLRDKRSLKVCCDEVLDGDKKEIAECVKLTTEKRKKREEAKAAKAAGTSSASSASPARSNSAAQTKPEVQESTSTATLSSAPADQGAVTASSADSGANTIKQATDLIKGVQGLKGRFGF